jgi:phosphoenolpyruvate carboxylase
MSIKKEEPKDLLEELEMLQRVLDNSEKSESSNADEFSGDIPVLDDMFDADIPTLSTASAGAALRAVPTLQPMNAVPQETSAPTPSQLSPLNQILDKINKQGANIDEIANTATLITKKTVETAATTQTLVNKRAEIDSTMTQTSSSLTNLLQRERLVDELVEEMLPLVKGRLRSRIREMINQEKIDKNE